MGETTQGEARNDALDERALDVKLALEVAREPGGEEIRRCFACGTCTAGCPVRRFNPNFNPRRVIRMVLLGMREQVLREPFVWLCASCYTCQERCPQGVRISDLMRAIKNMAVREGNMPEGIPLQVNLLKDKGTLYPLDDFDNKKRVKSGLPPMPGSHEDVGPLMEELEGLRPRRRDEG
ncbi:MAG: 4Fe-4S dicluster domain-containing protein [Thermodesulfobacteriota bacterium]